MRTIVVAVLMGATLALTGCQGATTAAPTPVRSTDLTSSDGGFDRNALVGVVLADGDDRLAADLRDGLDDAGFRPDVRLAPADGAAAAQRRAVDELVRGGAKALLVRAVDADALTGVVQTAHDAGVVVVSLGDGVPTSGTGGDGVSADHRVHESDDPAVTARTAVDVVRSLQRGERPDADD
ncbi:hypothetical protein DEJ23_03715 [Curtobacterium sp. MCSS17_008]|uniref:substrate-binding domain-containing protein n=1 Tax=Curtobacterium sp. MCSS17_008 TaxID=2175647 RepID=UPI000DA794E9|nr:substrate-binding domain-containing protein [Curtobacterium sp. MCSS17_008]PZF58895.1 hypothetical protein DEJ23_03715 [Curtobacterium sp. MCSS17_008]